MFSYLKINTNSKLLWTGAIFFICIIIVASSYLAFKYYYSNKFYPFISISNINLGGKTYDEGSYILKTKIDAINKDGIIFSYNGNETVITPTVSSFEIDLAKQIIFFNPDKSLNEAYVYGKNINQWQNLKNIINLLIFKNNIPIDFQINENEIITNLKNNLPGLETPAENASLEIEPTTNNINDDITFLIKPEKYGKKINYAKGIEELKIELLRLDNAKIILSSISDYPTIYKKDCLNIEASAKQIITNSPLTLKYNDKSWKLDKLTIAKILNIESENNNIVLKLGNEKLTEYIQKTISPEINVQPIDGRFEMKNGRVTEFLPSKEGIELDIENTIQKINTDFLENNINEIELPIKTSKSQISINDVNSLGIEKIIGTGHSNFAGSPKNRRHNIAVGSAAINGLLIAPNEEFSLIKTLGEINAKSGYLTELVIKDNKTIPEYGGGLCQVGTTVFRAALASGLDITARRNHSYRVSYYEPAGTDAAVYDPWPDVRFVNDTKNHILIQSRIEGNNLYYDFWGTSDGRLATTTKPVIYNIVKPAPTKIVETTDLKPGEKKCTEHAHNGADAYFDYKITYADGQNKEKRFSSHYVPWQEVCLVGVEKSIEPTDDSSATSINNQSNETAATSTEN
jgi:vancomycin resistance protein YoaR